MDRKDEPPETVHAFLWDRFREVRREINTQRFPDQPALLPHVIEWNERIVRFHILASHELIRLHNPATPGRFNAILNQEQMNKQILDLLGYYRKATLLGVPTPNAAEFKLVTLAGVAREQRERQGGGKEQQVLHDHHGVRRPGQQAKQKDPRQDRRRGSVALLHT
mmetsp:Transcript_450/g.919  ORF Transcript_450/g.919 Transcript_450/m.919 type:complete len:165 (-) Transcript_450:709-1203(-)